jgi:nitroreductase
MRPINSDKGGHPVNPTGGLKTVNDYHYWKADLEQRIGMFCTYCGIRLTNPQVEHVVPVHPVAGAPTGAALSWNNVVLACQPCNGAGGKSNKNYTPAQHYRPMDHNTLLPFINIDHTTTKEHVIVAVANVWNAAQQAKAQSTIGVFNWQQIDTRPNKNDYRSSERWQAKQSALAAFELFQLSEGQPAHIVMRAAQNVATMAVGKGFFSLWVEIFINKPEVLKWLIHPDYHPNTHQASFDIAGGTYQSIPRNPGFNPIDPI